MAVKKRCAYFDVVLNYVIMLKVNQREDGQIKNRVEEVNENQPSKKKKKNPSTWKSAGILKY